MPIRTNVSGGGGGYAVGDLIHHSSLGVGPVLAWEYETELNNDLLAPNGFLYYTSSGNLVKFDVDAKEEVWSVGDVPSGTLVYSNNTILAQAKSVNLTLFNADTGDEITTVSGKTAYATDGTSITSQHYDDLRIYDTSGNLVVSKYLYSYGTVAYLAVSDNGEDIYAITDDNRFLRLNSSLDVIANEPIECDENYWESDFERLKFYDGYLYYVDPDEGYGENVLRKIDRNGETIATADISEFGGEANIKVQDGKILVCSNGDVKIFDTNLNLIKEYDLESSFIGLSSVGYYTYDNDIMHYKEYLEILD